MTLLRVEIVNDYGDRVLVACPTPIATGTKSGTAPMRPMHIVSKADLVEELPKGMGPGAANSEARVRSARTVEGTERSERQQPTRSNHGEQT